MVQDLVLSGHEISLQLQQHGQQLVHIMRLLAVLVNEQKPSTFVTAKGQKGGMGQ